MSSEEPPLDLLFPSADDEQTESSDQPAPAETEQGGLGVFGPPEDDQPRSSGSTNETEFSDDIYKKWFRTSQKQGFLSIRGFLQAGKVNVDIGELTDGKPDNTSVWTNAIEFLTYLQAVTNGRGEQLYPARGNLQPETYEYYGGTNTDSGPISRVLKVNYWKDTDTTAFAFKAGHFKARQNEQGAFIPDMKQVLRMNMIKVSRAEVAQMAYRLDLAIKHYAMHNAGDIFKALNGNLR